MLPPFISICHKCHTIMYICLQICLCTFCCCHISDSCCMDEKQNKTIFHLLMQQVFCVRSSVGTILYRPILDDKGLKRTLTVWTFLYSVFLGFHHCVCIHRSRQCELSFYSNNSEYALSKQISGLTAVLFSLTVLFWVSYFGNFIISQYLPNWND